MHGLGFGDIVRGSCCVKKWLKCPFFKKFFWQMCHFIILIMKGNLISSGYKMKLLVQETISSRLVFYKSYYIMKDCMQSQLAMLIYTQCTLVSIIFNPSLKSIFFEGLNFVAHLYSCQCDHDFYIIFYY